MFTRTRFNQYVSTHGIHWAQYVAASFGVSKTQIELWTLSLRRESKKVATI